MDVGEGLSVSTVCPRLGCAGQDWGPGHSSHHPDDDMRGDQPTLTATLRAEIEVDSRQHLQYHHDRQDSLSLHQGDNYTLKAENKYVSILKIAERLGNCVCKYNSNFTLF